MRNSVYAGTCQSWWDFLIYYSYVSIVNNTGFYTKLDPVSVEPSTLIKPENIQLDSSSRLLCCDIPLHNAKQEDPLLLNT